MSRGARLLWTLPAVLGVQQLIVALPGDDVSGGPMAVPGFLLVLVLTWAAAERQSTVAWGLLVAFGVVAVVLAPIGIAWGYGAAAHVYLGLSVVALALLLWPESRAHVRAREPENEKSPA